jgi:rare lipoprotein A
VRINDRGPFIKGRSLDLSKAAAQRIGCAGVCRVKMTVVRRGK